MIETIPGVVDVEDVFNAFSIPAAAVADNAGISVVSIIRAGKAYETEVEIGTETANDVQIINGLAAGEIVTTAGGYSLPAGCPVTIVKNLGITSAIVESLLATTRSQRQQIVNTPKDLRRVVIGTVEFNEVCIAERNLTVLWNIADGAVIRGPAESINMSFRNLVENAVAYADAGSSINISGEHTAKSLVVQISNSARSFPCSDIDKVFERFWRADTSRTTTGKHSGLGLSLCKRLSESLGGTIVASYDDRRFTIKLEFNDNAN